MRYFKSDARSVVGSCGVNKGEESGRAGCAGCEGCAGACACMDVFEMTGEQAVTRGYLTLGVWLWWGGSLTVGIKYILLLRVTPQGQRK